MNISSKILLQRAQHGLSQEHIAERLGVTAQIIDDWENSKSIPGIEQVLQLSEMFNVSVDYLLRAQGSESHIDHASTSIVDDYDGGHKRVDYRFSFDLDNFIYPIAGLAYLVMGFYWGLWHPGWVIFIAAWVVDDIFSNKKKRRINVPIYGIAVLVYLLMGFYADLWHPGWIIFIVAGIISSSVKRVKIK